MFIDAHMIIKISKRKPDKKYPIIWAFADSIGAGVILVIPNILLSLIPYLIN